MVELSIGPMVRSSLDQLIKDLIPWNIMWESFSSEFQEFKGLIEGNREMSQLLRALAALAEGLSLVSEIKELTTACNSSPRGYPMISPVLCRDSHA